jgi:hypothetical protein
MMFMIGAFPKIGSPMYWLAPVVFLAVNFYNDEQGDENRWFNYLSYPVILLAVGLIAKYALLGTKPRSECSLRGFCGWNRHLK